MAGGGRPQEILANAVRRATGDLPTPLITERDIAARIEAVVWSTNRAGVRLLMACTLAKVMNPTVDIRKPYTEIGGGDCYSGRDYDQMYIGDFINTYELPANPTTAFLTPALRTKNITLMPGVNLGGRPPQMYTAAIALLSDVQEGRASAEDLLAEPESAVRQELKETFLTLRRAAETGST